MKCSGSAVRKGSDIHSLRVCRPKARAALPQRICEEFDVRSGIDLQSDTDCMVISDTIRTANSCQQAFPATAVSPPVNGVACLAQPPICCSEPQWDMLPRVTGIAIPANIIPRDGGFQTSTPSQPIKPMSGETKHFIERVLVPILVARYIAQRRAEEIARSLERLP